MKASPVISTIIIALLLGSVLGLVGFIAKMKYVDDTDSTEEVQQSHYFKDFVEFRFTGQPKLILIQDAENEVLFRTTETDDPYEHTAEINIPMDGEQKSHLKIFIEWEKSLEMNSFQMEFPGYLPKISDWSSGDIVTETEISWKEASDGE